MQEVYDTEKRFYEKYGRKFQKPFKRSDLLDHQEDFPELKKIARNQSHRRSMPELPSDTPDFLNPKHFQLKNQREAQVRFTLDGMKELRAKNRRLKKTGANIVSNTRDAQELDVKRALKGME